MKIHCASRYKAYSLWLCSCSGFSILNSDFLLKYDFCLHGRSLSRSYAQTHTADPHSNGYSRQECTLALPAAFIKQKIWGEKNKQKQSIIYLPCKYIQLEVWVDIDYKISSQNNVILCIKVWLLLHYLFIYFFYQLPMIGKFIEMKLTQVWPRLQRWLQGVCNHSLRLKPCFAWGSKILRVIELFKL